VGAGDTVAAEAAGLAATAAGAGEPGAAEAALGAAEAAAPAAGAAGGLGGAAGFGGAGRSGLIPPSQEGPEYISAASPLPFHFSSKSAAALFGVSPAPTTSFHG